MVDKIKEVVAEQLDCDILDINEDSSFTSDLGADSLDVVELVMSLEENFDCEISDEEAEKIVTFGDAVKMIDSKQ